MECLRAVADAALNGVLDGATLRSVDPDQAVRSVQDVKGLGPFAAELVVIRAANAPDALPHHEHRLNDEINHRYGPDRSPADIAAAWRPFRTWAAVHLRALANSAPTTSADTRPQPPNCPNARPAGRSLGGTHLLRQQGLRCAATCPRQAISSSGRVTPWPPVRARSRLSGDGKSSNRSSCPCRGKISSSHWTCCRTGARMLSAAAVTMSFAARC